MPESNGVKFFACGFGDTLICRVEIVPDRCVTIFGRVVDDNVRYAPEMQRLLDKVRPGGSAHFSQEDRDLYHPNGGPKKNKERYHHHVHVLGGLTEELIKKMSPWLSPVLKSMLTKELKT